MTIEDVITKYNGKTHNANEWWQDGAIDPREIIVELPWKESFINFQWEINLILDVNNPIQYISDEIGHKRFFLYYAD